MRVEIDDKSGFCFGVVRAITEAERALAEGGTVYSLGDIVHNRIEVQRLEQLGLRTVTHAAPGGLPPLHPRPRRTSYDLRRRPGNEHRDHRRHLPGGRTAATPREGGPRTDAPHRRAGGDPRQTGPRRSGGPHGAGRGPDDRDRTGGGPGADRLLASGLFPFADHAEHRAVRTAGRRNAPPGRRCDRVRIDDTICRQVSNREQHLTEFSGRFDAVVFVCGRKSSNGKVLSEVCRRANPRTHVVEEASEIDPAWFEGAATVGICGATSTPKWLMQDVADAIGNLNSEFKIQNS